MMRFTLFAENAMHQPAPLQTLLESLLGDSASPDLAALLHEEAKSTGWDPSAYPPNVDSAFEALQAIAAGLSLNSELPRSLAHAAQLLTFVAAWEERLDETLERSAIRLYIAAATDESEIQVFFCSTVFLKLVPIRKASMNERLHLPNAVRPGPGRLLIAIFGRMQVGGHSARRYRDLLIRAGRYTQTILDEAPRTGAITQLFPRFAEDRIEHLFGTDRAYERVLALIALQMHSTKEVACLNLK